MLTNYLKVALRYLMRHKEYTAINIFGLAVGIASCVLIMLFVRSEWSYDKFHSKSDRLYRMWQHEKYETKDFINSVTPLPMAAALQTSYGEIASTCRIYPMTPLIKLGNQSFSEETRMVDSTFFNLFDFKLLRGDKNNPFPTANSMVITPELAKKYFGKADPMGKTVEIEMGSEKVPFSVSGIVEPAPEASSIKFRLLIPFINSQKIFRPNAQRSWFNVYVETYVLLKEGVTAASLEKKFPVLLKQQLGEDYNGNNFLMHMQPIADIHLNTTVPEGIEPISNPKYSYILASIGVLILLVACIN